MTTRSTARSRRLAVAAIAAVLGCTGCSITDTAAPRPAGNVATADQTGSLGGHSPVHRPVIPTESPAAGHPVAAPGQYLAIAVVPSASMSTSTPLGVARAWAIAANSSSYRDSNAGQWTLRQHVGADPSGAVRDAPA
jgi:hypothetical protein